MGTFKSEFSGTDGQLEVEDHDRVRGLTFTINGSDTHLYVEELLRLHAALGTYIVREGLAL